MLVDEPLLLPDIEPGANAVRVATAQCFDQHLLVVMLDVVGRVDVASMIDILDTVGHAPITARVLLLRLHMGQAGRGLSPNTARRDGRLGQRSFSPLRVYRTLNLWGDACGISRP